MRVIPAQAGIHLTWAPAFAGATGLGIFIQLSGPQAHDNSVESRVILATRRPKALGRRAEAGIQILAEMDPRPLGKLGASSGQAIRGGDEGLTFIIRPESSL